MPARAPLPKATTVLLQWAAEEYPEIRSASRPLGEDRFIVIKRTGGVRRDALTDDPQFTIQWYDQDAGLAEEGIEDLRTRLANLAGSQVIDGVRCKGVTEYSGPTEQPDPDSPNHSRYSYNVALALKAT